MKRTFVSIAAGLALAAGWTGSAAAASPTVTTGSAAHIAQTTAELTGTVNPNHVTTSYFFQWGLTTGYGLNNKVHSAGSGTKTRTVNTTASDLIPGTVYHYRLVAVSRAGIAVGADRTFATAGPPPPVVATGPATGIGVNTATLTGVINPNGGVTGWKFEYWANAADVTYTAGGTVPSGKTPVLVAQSLSGLAQGTFFHYRLIAYHGNVAITEGSYGVLLTVASPKPKPRVRAVTRPRHAHKRPFTLTTTGKVFGPGSIPGAFDCNGYAAVRYFYGRRNVAFALVPVQPDCSYSSTAVFARLPGHGRRGRTVTLRVAVRFRGNTYLTPAYAKDQKVILG